MVKRKENDGDSPNLIDFMASVSSTKKAIRYAREIGLLLKQLECKKCGNEMAPHKVKTSVSSDEEIFKCTNRKCRHSCSIREGSIFKVSHIFGLC